MDSDNKEQALKAQNAYWRANVTTLLCLLAVWFVVSFGCFTFFWIPFPDFSRLFF